MAIFCPPTSTSFPASTSSSSALVPTLTTDSFRPPSTAISAASRRLHGGVLGLLLNYNRAGCLAAAQVGNQIRNEINQYFVRVETEDPLRIRHEVGKCIHVVKIGVAVAVVHQILDTTQIQTGLLRNCQHPLHDGTWEFVRLNAHLALLRFSTRTILNHRFAFGGGRLLVLADVCWTQVEASSFWGEEANRVKELAVEHFHTNYSTVTSRQEFLYERGIVNAQINGSRLHGAC